jgi:hypothetical protein
MKSLRVALRHTDETIHPMHAVVCESPSIDREVILGGREADGTETVLSYVEGDRGTYEAALTSQPIVEEYDITSDGEREFFVYARHRLGEQGVIVAAALERETVVLVPPIEFRSDRTTRFSLIGPSDELQATLDALPAEIDVDVLRIGDYTEGVGGGLTDRQREAVTVAWKVGYYTIPRTGDLEAVAGELGCATATASNLLRRAEARLVARELGDRTAMR